MEQEVEPWSRFVSPSTRRCLPPWEGLANHKHCTLDELLVRLIDEGLTVELKIADLKVLGQTRKNT
jgi:hypothetical protein